MNAEDLLIDKKIPYYAKGKDFLVRCLNPEHDDNNPSMRIDQITGIFNCFACGFKGNIFHFYGEKANQLQLRRENLKKKIRQKMSEGSGLAFPKGYLPYDGNWRDIKPETYKKFQAFTHHDKDHIGRLVFPVRDISGRVVSFNGRHMSGGTPKYMITPRGVKLPLFPKVTAIKGSIILVEGIFDAINLHDKGLTNAVCCFGTNNINEEKLSLLSLQGITGIDIFFDGDDAGQKAAENVKDMCEKVDLTSRNVFIENTDPGALVKSQVEKLKERLYG
jgi:DNA primase